MTNDNKIIISSLFVVLVSVVAAIASVHSNINCDHFVIQDDQGELLDSLHMTTKWITHNNSITMHNDSMNAEMAKFRYDSYTRKWELK
jgi:hypothetical protein